MGGVFEMQRHSDDPIRAYRRQSVAARRKVGQSCKCGENRAEALVVICAECLREASGQSICDAHHVAARANHRLTVPVPANDHRAILSDAQYDWPTATFENKAGSPLLAGAGCIRGYYETNSYLTDQLLIWVAKLLEALDEVLTERLGPNWWVGTKLEQFAPKRLIAKCFRRR